MTDLDKDTTQGKTLTMKNVGWGIFWIILGLLIVFVLATGRLKVLPELSGRLWVSGAAALGLLCGFATGASGKAGTSGEFVKMVGTGVVIPILGAVSSFLGKTQKITEHSTYADTQLVEKTTLTTDVPNAESIPTLAILGAFFLAFALCAFIGLLGGALLKKGGSVELPLKRST